MSSIMATVFTAWGYEVSFLELISVITSTVGVVLGVFGVRITWPWWVASSILYAIFFFQVNLIASALLQFVFVAAGIWGWFGWGPKGAIPAKLKNNEKLIWLAMLLVSWIALAPALAKIGAAATWPDSFVLVGSTVAQVLMVLEKYEAWPLWFVVDAVATWHYGRQGYWFTSLLYGLFVLIAIAGWVRWFQRADTNVRK